MLTMKNEIFEQYSANGKSQTNYEWLQLISNSLTETIISPKKSYIPNFPLNQLIHLRHQKPIGRYSKLS